MKRTIFVFILIATLLPLVVSCKGKANGIETGSTGEIITQWLFSESKGGTQTLERFSSNYYVINNRKIALILQLADWPASPTEKNRNFIGFYFADITDKDTSIKPSFNISGNKFLTMVFKKNGESVSLNTQDVDTSTLMVYNPQALKFIKTINEYGGFSMQITLSDGVVLKYDFEIDQNSIFN